MGYELFFSIIAGISAMYIILMLVKYIFARKKRHKRKRYRRRALIAGSIILVTYMIRPMASFSTLEKAVNFYIGKGNVGTTVINGESSALVFGYNNSMTYFFEHRNGKWKLPGYDAERIDMWYQQDEINEQCNVETDHIGNEKGIYIILRDAKLLQEYPKESVEKITDSQGNKFIFARNAWNDGYFCVYLQEIPENYKILIDGQKVNVDWDKLFAIGKKNTSGNDESKMEVR